MTIGAFYASTRSANPNAAGPLINDQLDLVIGAGVVFGLPHAVAVALAGDEGEPRVRLEAADLIQILGSNNCEKRWAPVYKAPILCLIIGEGHGVPNAR